MIRPNWTYSRAGQSTVEMVLLVWALFFVTILIFKTLRNQGVVSQLVDGPWSVMAGMIENGVWGSPAKTKIVHPNYLRRHISMKGEAD